MSEQDIIDSYKGKVDPTDELPEELEKIALDRADKWMEDNAKLNTKQINLMEEEMKVPNQKYALVSFIGPHCTQASDKLAMKIYGVFNDVDSARNWAQDLQKKKSEDDVQFNIFIQELYNWCPIPPDISKIDEQYYANDALNEMINKQKHDQKLASEKFNIRKDVLMGNSQVNTKLLAEQAGVDQDEVSAGELLKALEET